MLLRGLRERSFLVFFSAWLRWGFLVDEAVASTSMAVSVACEGQRGRCRVAADWDSPFSALAAAVLEAEEEDSLLVGGAGFSELMVASSFACRRSARAFSTGPKTLARSLRRLVRSVEARSPFAIAVVVVVVGFWVVDGLVVVEVLVGEKCRAGGRIILWPWAAGGGAGGQHQRAAVRARSRRQ